MATGFGRSCSRGCTEVPIPFPVNPRHGEAAFLELLPTRFSSGPRACQRLSPRHRAQASNPSSESLAMARLRAAPRCYSIRGAPGPIGTGQEPIRRPHRPLCSWMVPGLLPAAPRKMRVAPGQWGRMGLDPAYTPWDLSATSQEPRSHSFSLPRISSCSEVNNLVELATRRWLPQGGQGPSFLATSQPFLQEKTLEPLLVWASKV